MTDLIQTSSLIAAAEVWVQSTHNKQWQLVEGYYGDCTELRTDITVRNEETGIFQFIAEERRPLLLANIQGECALRSISCPDDVTGLLIIPTFDKGTITSVLVCFLRISNNTKGAAEIWAGKENAHELSLIDGFYSGLQRFGKISQYIHMPYGSGLPGMAWRYGSAQLLTGIDHSKGFLRSSSAASEGLHTGIAIPVIDYHTVAGIVTLLSSATSPIGQVYEVWKPDVINGSPSLSKISAHYGDHHTFQQASQRLTMQPGEGLVGKAWAARRPIIMNDLSSNEFLRSDAAQQEGLEAAIAIPSMLGDVVHSICVILW